jgi:chemotaxis protein MotB
MSYRRASVRAGQDRWLMSYADLVTLLFACFTTTYAASMMPAEAPAPTPAVTIAEVSPLHDVAEDPAPVPPVPSLRDRLEPILAGGLADVEIEMVEDARGLVISLPETATFPVGRADLAEPARSLLMRISDALGPTGASIRVEGHTDDAAVRGGRYESNWELSTARASAVVVFMVTEAGLDPSRLSAAGYGEFHPRASNDDDEGRALNRRVDIVVIEASDVPKSGELIDL